MVKNLSSNAGDVGLISVRGAKIPYAGEQLSPRATVRKVLMSQQRPGAAKKNHVGHQWTGRTPGDR